MKQKIISRLKEKFSGVNLSNARLDAIADKLAPKITDETTIDAKLDELNEILPFADIAKQDDRVRTLEANQKKPEPPKQPTSAPNDPAKPEGESETDKTLKLLLQKIEQLESGKAAESNTNRLVTLLKEKKVPESYYNVAIAGRTFKDATEVETFATTVTEAFTKYNQEIINKGLLDQPEPVMGVVKDPAKEVSTGMKEYLATKQTETKKTA